MIEPLVSVLCITYNHAPYIAQAIESFLAQKTSLPFEIVIGEDCSTDRTQEIVLDYAQRYPDIIRVVTSDHNVGSVPNFLRTLDACTGKYVATCEGDDYWHHSGKLQMQVDFLEANPEYGMVHSDFDQIDTITGEVVKSYSRAFQFKHEKEEGLVTDLLLGDYNMVTATMFMRRSIVADIVRQDPLSFDERYVIGDLQLRVGMAHRSKIKYLDVSTASYRLLQLSATRDPSYRNQLRFSQCGYEINMHLCAHYGCSPSVRCVVHRRDAKRLLKTALLADDSIAASIAIRRVGEEGLGIPWLAWCYYYLATSRPLGSLVRSIVSFRAVMRRYIKLCKGTVVPLAALLWECVGKDRSV